MEAQLTKSGADVLGALSGQLKRAPGIAGECKSLTRREKDVLEQLSRGFLYKEIVANLGISHGTLNSCICKVYKKLQVHSRTEAVVKYLVQQPVI